MTYRVRVTGPAERDIRGHHRWWSAHRSPSQADRWFAEINRAVQSLATMPLRFRRADEQPLMDADIHQMPVGVGRRATHRIIFGVTGQEVVIYRVRAFAQDRLEFEELASHPTVTPASHQ